MDKKTDDARRARGEAKGGRMMRRARLMASSVIATFGVTAVLPAGPAFAEDTVHAGRGLEEIMVTARKRDENLQDTPISVAAFSGEALEQRGLSNIAQMAEFTPNLTFQTGASLGSSTSASIYIRGVGQNDYALVVDPGVGLYVDGVYLSRSIGGVLDILDFERIEVLRGPQGTLFGKNTIGGAINIVSRRPTSELSGYVEGTAGNFNRVDVKAAINIPIGERLRTKFSVGRLTRDGFVKQVGLPFIPASNDIANAYMANGLLNFTGVHGEGEDIGFLGSGRKLGNQNALILRYQADFDASDRFTVQLDADYTRKREESAARVLSDIEPIDEVNFTEDFTGNPLGWRQFAGYRYRLPGETQSRSAAERVRDMFGLDSIFDILPTSGNKKYVDDGDMRRSTQGVGSPSQSDLDVWGVGLTLKWALSDNMDVKSISAYRKTEAVFARDQDGSPFVINDSTNIYDSKQFSQELQLSGVSFDGRLNWIVGGYYANEKGHDANYLSLFPVSIASGGSITIDSYAVFGQATYDLTERLSVTAGLRWSQDDKEFTADPGGIQQRITSIVGIGILPPPFEPGSVPLVIEQSASDSYSSLSPRVSVEFSPTDDLLTYASYSSGYKSGGFNQRLAPVFQTIPKFDEETIDVFEVGFKWTGFDRRLRLNAAAFYSDYKDMQLVGIQNVSPVIENAAKSEIKGLELEFQALVNDYISLDGGFGYTDAKYKSFDETVAIDAGGRMTSPKERLALSGIFESNDLANTPKYNLNLGIELHIPVLGGNATLRGDYAYRSKIALDYANMLMEDSLSLFHASLTFTPADELWTIMLAGRNLTNERYGVSGFADPAGIGTYTIQPARPREWFVSVKRQF